MYVYVKAYAAIGVSCQIKSRLERKDRTILLTCGSAKFFLYSKYMYISI